MLLVTIANSTKFGTSTKYGIVYTIEVVASVLESGISTSQIKYSPVDGVARVTFL